MVASILLQGELFHGVHNCNKLLHSLLQKMSIYIECNIRVRGSIQTFEYVWKRTRWKGEKYVFLFFFYFFFTFFYFSLSLSLSPPPHESSSATHDQNATHPPYLGDHDFSNNSVVSSGMAMAFFFTTTLPPGHGCNDPWFLLHLSLLSIIHGERWGALGSRCGS